MKTMMKLSNRAQNLFCFAVLSLSVYIFAPRFWEPSAETLRYWAFARILRETGGFPVFSGGPLYVLYLQLFSFFEYPLSFQIEFFITHLFCAACIFLMLRRIVNDFPALLLTCAWLPAIALVQGTAAVAGMGFVALYLTRNVISSNENDHYLSLSLGAAALCHSAYMPFFAAHTAGVFIKRLKSKSPIISKIRKIRILPFSLYIALIILIMTTILFQSPRWDNSHMMMPAKYVPVPMDNPLMMGFFQIGNFRYVKQNMPESEWLFQDWYFTHEKAFGGATTFLQALSTKPDFVFSILVNNFKSFLLLPTIFLSESVLPIFASDFLKLLLWGLVFIGILGIIKRCKVHEQLPLLITIFFGTISIIGALFLTRFNLRYVMTLLPIALFVLAHIGLGFKSLVLRGSTTDFTKKDPRKYFHMFNRSLWKERISFFASKQVLLGILGMAIIVLGMFPARQLIKLLSRFIFGNTEIFSLGVMVFIGFVISFALIATGAFVVKRYCPLWPSYLLRQVSCHFKGIIALFATVLIIGNLCYSIKMEGVINMFSTKYLLTGSKPVSIMTTHKTLLSSINRRTSVLALEETWIKAFADVDLDQVYSVFGLPPFEDESGKTEDFLSRLDVIWVSNNWISTNPAISTNYFLRYQLHIKPFLERETAIGNWVAEEVNDFGRIYKKKVK